MNNNTKAQAAQSMEPWAEMKSKTMHLFALTRKVRKAKIKYTKGGTIYEAIITGSQVTSVFAQAVLRGIEDSNLIHVEKLEMEP